MGQFSQQPGAAFQIAMEARLTSVIKDALFLKWQKMRFPKEHVLPKTPCRENVC
jgi:hypothetical protein